MSYVQSSLGSTKRKVFAAAALAVVGLGLAGVAPSASATGGKGLTFGKYIHDQLGVDRVGIYGTGNPYVGDTSCKLKRPILCIKHDGSARPPYDVLPAGTEFYQGWIEGHLATTLPVKGSTLSSVADGDTICVNSFGPGWQMAEFHDGMYVPGMNTSNYYYSVPYSGSPWPTGGVSHGGHGFWGWGNINPNARYWVYINDQPANCWNP